MKRTRAQQNALARMQIAIETIQELAPLEIARGESEPRRKKIVRAYESLTCHGFTLHRGIPKLSSWYYPEQYLAAVSQIADQLKPLQEPKEETVCAVAVSLW